MGRILGPFDVIVIVIVIVIIIITVIVGNYDKSGPAGGIVKPFWLSDPTDPMFYFEDTILENQAGQVLSFDDPWAAAHGLLGSVEMGNALESQRLQSRPDYSGIRGLRLALGARCGRGL